MAFCSNCGKFVNNTAKFCSTCGSTISSTGSTPPITQPKAELATTATATHKNDLKERRLFFDGEILKCPHCGEVLTSFTPNCPSCGNELRGLKSANSIQDFTNQLELIERNREEDFFSTFNEQKINSKTLTATDSRKINLIQNFPIPNTKEDIREFIILSFSTMQTLNPESYTDKALYNAWEIKYRQACGKALLLFSKDELKQLKQLGFKKPKHLDLKKNGWSSWSLFGKIVWVILNIYTFGIPTILYAVAKKFL